MADTSLITLLQRLVAVPSINPELSSDPFTAGESRMADCLTAELKSRGFRIDRVELTRDRPNVVGRFGPASPKRRFLFESHLDTQAVHGMTVPPFAGEVSGGRLYGRGSCDMKGPMAAALHVLNAGRLDRLAKAGWEILFVGAVGEERGNLGAEQLAESGLGADAAIVLEPTGLRIVHAHKGAFWLRVETVGVAAHGSNPKAGLSAISAMSSVMSDIERQTAEAGAQHHHAALGRPTVNIGVIRGGTSTNIVPERCEIEVDRRTLPDEDRVAIRARIEASLRALQDAGRIVGSRVEIIKDSPPFATRPDSSLIRELQAACRAHGAEGVVEGAGWYSDAGPFSRTCPEIAVFGPGDIAQAHTADEYIELDSLQRGADILSTFLDRLAGRTAT